MGDTDGAAATRDAAAAQSLYDKCPEALQKVMNALKHNKGKKGKRVDYQLVIADINECKDDDMIGVFEAQSRQNSVPRAAAADLTKKDSPSTPQSKPSKPQAWQTHGQMRSSPRDTGR